MSDDSDSSEGLFLEGGPQGILMLHGLGANALELTHLARHLHQGGFTVHVPDLDGYCFDSEPTTWPQWLSEARAHLWRLRERCETVSVVGLSMGATLALQLAQDESLPALVLLSTALAYDGWAIPRYSFLIRLAPWLTFLKRYRYAETEPYGIKNPQMRERIRRAMQQSHVSESGADVLSYTHISQGLSLVDAARRGIDQVQSPVLFIHAADDETVHPRNIDWACAHIGSADKDVLWLGDSYHMITVDNERETVAQETLRYLQQRVNSELGRAVFEMPPIYVAELRRQMRGR